MKLFSINSANDRKNINFDGKRINKNAIKQLTRNNPFSLTEPNQRLISNAIEEMSKVKGVNNIKFLLDSAAKVTYSTNIQNDIPAKNDWRGKLVTAALSAIAITPFVPKELKQKATELLAPKELTETEKEIVNLGEQLLAVVDLEQINKEMFGTSKEFKKNLNYFIVSSETTLEHKKYVLERLNYFMSDDYEINPQLANKKSIALAEMVNDMTIAVPGNKIPNIKAVNQKSHGMCGTISIVRKKLVYEDKAKYVDTILSELDSSPVIMVYDRNKLGSGEKIAVNKVPVDFETALKLGYRIIDASTLHWMQISSMGGSNNFAYEEYHPFDKENFDVYTDRFYNVKIADENLQAKQVYYQALNKALSVIEDYIASDIKRKVSNRDFYLNKDKEIGHQAKIYEKITNILSNILDDNSNENIRSVINMLWKLEHKNSKDIKANEKYAFIANEEDEQKLKKIKLMLSQYSKKEISDDTIKELYSLIEFYKTNAPSRINNNSKIAKYLKAEELYTIAAAFRNQLLRGLESEENINVVIQTEGLPVKEHIITDTIDKLINNIENNSQHSNKIIEQISANYNINKNKDDVVKKLKELKNQAEYILENEINYIYETMTFGSKKQSLYNSISVSYQAVLNKDSDTIKSMSAILGVKPNPNKIAKILKKDLEELEINDNKETYNKLLLKYGLSSEVSLLKEIFKDLISQMAFGLDENFINNFVSINKIDLEENPEAFANIIETLEKKISNIEEFFKQNSSLLKIKDDDGDILFSADPKDIIIKKFETSQRIPDYKSMRELQAHKERVDNAWGRDEFGSRKKFYKNKELFKFSRREITTLKIIEDNINSMYKYIQKELPIVRREIRTPLEELNQIIGLNQGEYWVDDDNSGVSTAKMIRAIEYLTGRPHYSTTNYKKAAEKIKTSPYSGITSSFTRHNRGGMHAQYIADIEPIKVMVKDKDGNEKIVEKEILFHDNTWGIAEQENTWVDSQGLTRTDYKNFSGGTLGYITNSSLRNGNFIDRITDEMVLKIEPDYVNSKAYKKIRPYSLGSEYARRQYDDVIVDGKSPELKTLAADLHDTLFSRNGLYLKKLEKFASNLNTDELKAEIKKLSIYNRSWVDIYKNLEKRIYGDMFIKPIETKEEFDSLPNDDYLKVILEKVALSENFSTIGMTADLVKVKNTEELEKFRKAQKSRAINSFKYSFAKSSTIISHLAKKFDTEEENDILNILKKYDIKLSEKEENLIFPDFVIDTKDFNGSAKHTITILMREISKSIDKAILNSEAAEELKNYYRNFLKENLYFNAQNLEEKDSLNITHLVEFIDRVYDPSSDEEFIQIYRKLQDMTNEEFKKKVLPKATTKDIGLGTSTGYDILKKIQMYDDQVINSLQNSVILDSLASELNLKKYQPEYVHKKLTRFAKVKEDNDFNYYYNTIRNTLSILSLEKLFNKYKGRAIENGRFPAYPKTDILSEELFKTSYNNAINTIEGNIHKIKGLSEQIESYDITHKLTKYLNKLNPEDVPSDYQYKRINTLLGRLITLNANDPSVANVLDSAESALEFELGTSWNNYIPHIKDIVKTFSDFENTTSKEQIEQIIDKLKVEIDLQEKIFAEALVQKKYQNRIIEDMNNLKQALIKDNNEEAEILKENFYNDFVKAHILQNPTELLDSYLKSLTKDSELETSKDAFKALIERGLAFAKLAEIQELIMNAISDGTAINIKTMFDNITVPLNIGEFKMSSDEVVSVMVNSLMLDNSQDTALFFIDKIGLGEQYVRYVTKNIKLDEMKNMVDNSHKVSQNFINFKNSINPSIEKIKELLAENNEYFLIILEHFKKFVRKQAKQNNIPKESFQIILKAIDSCKEAYILKPDSKQLFIFETTINEALNVISQITASAINSVNQYLNSNNTMINLANNIPLQKDSEINKLREEFNKKYEELSKYSQSLNLQAEEDSDKI